MAFSNKASERYLIKLTKCNEHGIDSTWWNLNNGKHKRILQSSGETFAYNSSLILYTAYNTGCSRTVGNKIKHDLCLFFFVFCAMLNELFSIGPFKNMAIIYFSN